MDLRSRKVLVTGADGFIGSHLTERLVAEGCAVRAFVYYNSFNSWGWLEQLPPDVLSQIEVVPGDIRDSNAVRLATRGIDVVFHLAALIAIPFSYQAPESYVDTNVKGTLNVLMAGRDEHCSRILVTSTSEVYGTAQYVPIDEVHPYQAQSPYSATKIAADRIAEAFYRSFDSPVCIVRPFNTYGPRQSARAVIPTLITQMLGKQQQINLGSLTPTRDFVFVKDTVEGFVAIARADDVVGEEINIATASEISIGDLVIKLKQLTGSGATVVTQEERLRPDKSEVFRLLGSNEKISRLTGWRPNYTLDRGLDETVAWFRTHAKSYKSDIYNT